MTNRKVGDIIECKPWLTEEESDVQPIYDFVVIKIARKWTYIKLEETNELYKIENSDTSERPLGQRHYGKI